MRYENQKEDTRNNNKIISFADDIVRLALRNAKAILGSVTRVFLLVGAFFLLEGFAKGMSLSFLSISVTQNAALFFHEAKNLFPLTRRFSEKIKEIIKITVLTEEKNNLENNLKKMIRIMKTKGMKLNKNKTKVMVITKNILLLDLDTYSIQLEINKLRYAIKIHLLT